MAVVFSPAGTEVFVALAGLNAVEVLSVKGESVHRIPQTVTVEGEGAGPGYYGQVQPTVGTGTEGTISAIDVPTELNAQFASEMSANLLSPPRPRRRRPGRRRRRRPSLHRSRSAPQW